jgi:hypothetical protein
MKIKTGCYTTLENHKIKSNFYVINRISLCANAAETVVSRVLWRLLTTHAQANKKRVR